MPKRIDIKKILIIGSGPIIIGQACEFDYSGTQACKALKADGYHLVLVNSNPATIMTDPEFADHTYIEPLTVEYLEAIIERERPDALLPTVGGQTALNLSVELAERGILDRYNVQLIGASLNAIKMAEDRLWFKDAMQKVGLDVPRSVLVKNVEAAHKFADQIGLPLNIRPSFTLRRTGPGGGRMVVIEINPRVSRSSALASKATGFPIAKIAARLAVGYRLDEIPNDITQKTPSCFEPTIDYVVVKIPKWAHEKFPDADHTLGTQMKSVGEVMAIGRTFKEALMKGIRSLETGRKTPAPPSDPGELQRRLAVPHPERIWDLFFAFQAGYSVEALAEITRIDPWFLDQVQQIVEMQWELKRFTVKTVPAAVLREAKRNGFSDAHLAELWSVTEEAVRALPRQEDLRPVFKRVDTCAAEFESFTPYLYSTYEEENEAEPTDRRKIMILGSGPNRIGQGIEFDYCFVHAAYALRNEGFETIMCNCNPETDSTDYDTSDRLYFEPLTLEDVLAIFEEERPQGGIVQFGGQTPLNLARELSAAGVPIVGTSPESIDLAEDRKRFGKLLAELEIVQPANGAAMNVEEALAIANRIGYPVLVRPSYVLGGRAMVIAFDDATLRDYVARAEQLQRAFPILIDRFLENALEIDVDALSDGEDVVIAGVMQHIEEAGIHSGDSSCVLPSVEIPGAQRRLLLEYTRKLALELKVVGLMNVQYAIQNGKVYVLEVNPRASRTVPYVSKATGVPLAKFAALLMVGHKLREFGLEEELPVRHYFVKSPVFPFQKFPGVDPILGPEMKSTGEVMAAAESFGLACPKP